MECIFIRGVYIKHITYSTSASCFFMKAFFHLEDAKGPQIDAETANVVHG